MKYLKSLCIATAVFAFTACNNGSGNDPVNDPGNNSDGSGFIAVSSISGVPNTGYVDTPLILTGTIYPPNATKQDIVWSIRSNGQTNSAINGNVLTAAAKGKVTVTAAIIDGKAVNKDYTSSFNIDIEDAPSFIPVTSITGIPESGLTGKLSLAGTVNPAGATNQTMVWSVVNPGTTGASINGNILTTTSGGTVIIKAAISKGVSDSSDYTQNFSITIEALIDDIFTEPERVITAKAFVKDMGLGFNIGNNLDSWGGETAWGNVAINQAFIKALKGYGYKTIRLPITWAENLGPAPDYIIKASWLDRIETIVNWCLEEDMYVIINIHHDGHGNAKSWIQNAPKGYPDNGANVTAVANQMAAVWAQIAARFSHAPDYLVFEAMNEVGFDDLWNRYQGGQAAQKAEAYRILNLLNQTFVNTVRAAGYNNKFRFLLIPGYWTDIDNTCDAAFKMPADNINDRLTLSVHYYTPWDFAGDSKTAVWGTASDINTLNNLFNKLKINFIDKGIPVILGEYNVINKKGSVIKAKEERVKWLTAVTKKCIELGICPVLWDNGGKVSSGFHDMGEIYRDAPAVISDALKEVLDTVLPLP